MQRAVAWKPHFCAAKTQRGGLSLASDKPRSLIFGPSANTVFRKPRSRVTELRFLRARETFPGHPVEFSGHATQVFAPPKRVFSVPIEFFRDARQICGPPSRVFLERSSIFWTTQLSFFQSQLSFSTTQSSFSVATPGFQATARSFCETPTQLG